MTIRWRLLVLAAQLTILLCITFHLTGSVYTSQIWFLGGLLAIAINPQLWEPYFPKPADVIGNGLIFLFIFATTQQTITKDVWMAAAFVVTISILLSVFALLLGFRKDRLARLGRAARLLSQFGTAKTIYSGVFVLSAIEWRPSLDIVFWKLMGAWILILWIGSVNWESVYYGLTGQAVPVRVEGNIGPSVLLLSGIQMPAAGSCVELISKTVVAEAVVLNRIRRPEDDWAEVHVLDSGHCGSLITGPPLKIRVVSSRHDRFLGSVDAGSTEGTLRFLAIRAMEVSQVVATEDESGRSVIYQIIGARIDRSEVKGGGQLVVRAEAQQLGIFDVQSSRFIRHRWVPKPGAAVFSQPEVSATSPPPSDWLLLGKVSGTEVPVYLNLNAACEGHLAILGMTKMGKTSLAVRLAKALSHTRCVAILDQTGEYVNRRKLQPVSNDTQWNCPGLSVIEPKAEEVPADRALQFLRSLLKTAAEEYRDSTVFPRSIIIDEAHQFIPEPAGLGFNAPGRESSITIGLLMMQIRKYGISVFLISQRTAVVAKSALSQCENLIAFRSVDQTGLDYLEAVAGSGVRSLLPQLKQGEALVFGPAISSESPVAITIVED